jgi:EAL domain-containing protein (putative c-di-GMP-specific phosphodiesterase class I)
MTISSNIRSNAPESQLVLLLDDDLMITDGLAAGLEREGRTVISCNDVESAELMVARLHPSHVVTDMRISGPFSRDGLDFITFVSRHAPGSGVILMSGDAPEAMRIEGAQRGAAAFLQKPFEVDELDCVLNTIASSALSGADDDHRHIRVPLIDEVLQSGHLHPFFQPIVALGSVETRIGYESLARYRTNSPMRNPDLLFQYATRKNRVAELEFACMTSTLAVANAVSRTALVFINLHPDALRKGARLREVVIENARRNDVSLDRIVLEITEQGQLPDIHVVFETIEHLRALGVRFALDDIGSTHSHLLIGKLRPSFLKISPQFGTRFERDRTKTTMVTNVVALAGDYGCEVIIEGIEDRSTAQAATDLKIPLAQGYLFGRPADPFATDVAASRWIEGE